MARKFWFQITDESGNVEIGRTVTFPYEIDAYKIDAEIALIFLKIDAEREKTARKK